jgi:hypothetical protein
MKKTPILPLVLATLLLAPSCARATLYRHITAESPAVINSDGSLTEASVTYPAIYKPTPQASWVQTPWLDSSLSYKGEQSVGMEIDAVSSYASGDVDKVNHRISSGNDSFALGFGNIKRYTGFALYLPSGEFEIPAAGRKLMLAQWWQGSPYGPPLRLEVTNATTSAVTFRFWVLNNDTLGNPSATPIDIGGGTIPFDAWTRFVVMLIPDYSGGGQIKVWVNGTQIITWAGKVGYDPTTKPYTGDTSSIAYPNQAFDVFYGPYRDRQNKTHVVLYDEIKFASTYSEAAP